MTQEEKFKWENKELGRMLKHYEISRARGSSKIEALTQIENSYTTILFDRFKAVADDFEENYKLIHN